MREPLEHCSTVEREIIRKLVRAALASGYSVSVWDGEAMPLKRSVDMRAILDAMASTGSDTLHFRDKTSDARVGMVLLIYGNDDDLISDHSDNAAIQGLIDRAEGRARRVS